jgi:hypothetical protein
MESHAEFLRLVTLDDSCSGILVSMMDTRVRLQEILLPSLDTLVSMMDTRARLQEILLPTMDTLVSMRDTSVRRRKSSCRAWTGACAFRKFSCRAWTRACP